MRWFNLLTLGALFSSVLAGPTSLPVLKARASSSSPKVVIYTDDTVSTSTGLPSAADIKGYNVLILSFLLLSGAADQALQWTTLSAATRKSILAEYDAAGIKLMVSSFGSTDAPTSSGADAKATGEKHAAWVKQWGLAGIDVDYEDMNAVNAANGKAEQWLITYTQALRDNLPAGQYAITHAPVAPWFSPMYKAGAYTKVHAQVGDLIDWYNVQFYNQGNTEYTTCEGLLTHSTNAFPQSSVFEINSVAGVPLHKIVIGKPSQAYQAANGFMATNMLTGCLQQAVKQGWNAGTMFWEYEKALGLNLVSAVVDALADILDDPSPSSGSSSSVSAAHPSATSTSVVASKTKTIAATKSTESATSVPSPSSSSAPSSDGGDSSDCPSAKPWSADTVYGALDGPTGAYVTYSGSTYESKWWTQGDAPGSMGDADPWRKVKSCDSGSSRRSMESNGTHEAKRSHRAVNSRKRMQHAARLNDMSS